MVGGLLTKPCWPGDSAAALLPFPTLLVRISHIVVGATDTEDSLVMETDGECGTHRDATAAVGTKDTQAQGLELPDRGLR
jgi:hypothetical protein